MSRVETSSSVWKHHRACGNTHRACGNIIERGETLVSRVEAWGCVVCGGGWGRTEALPKGTEALPKAKRRGGVRGLGRAWGF